MRRLQLQEIGLEEGMELERVHFEIFQRFEKSDKATKETRKVGYALIL